MTRDFENQKGPLLTFHLTKGSQMSYSKYRQDYKVKGEELMKEENTYILTTLEVNEDGELVTIEKIVDEDYYKTYISIFGGK